MDKVTFFSRDFQDHCTGYQENPLIKNAMPEPEEGT